MTVLETAIQEYQDQIEKVQKQMEEIHIGFSIFPNPDDAKAYGECEGELDRLHDLVNWLTELKERREADKICSDYKRGFEDGYDAGYDDGYGECYEYNEGD